MAHTLTNYADDIINRLVLSGRYNNRSEVMRAYRRQKNEAATETAATRASRRRTPRFDE